VSAPAAVTLSVVLVPALATVDSGWRLMLGALVAVELRLLLLVVVAAVVLAVLLLSASDVLLLALSEELPPPQAVNRLKQDATAKVRILIFMVRCGLRWRGASGGGPVRGLGCGRPRGAAGRSTDLVRRPCTGLAPGHGQVPPLSGTILETVLCRAFCAAYQR